MSCCDQVVVNQCRVLERLFRSSVSDSAFHSGRSPDRKRLTRMTTHLPKLCRWPTLVLVLIILGWLVPQTTWAVEDGQELFESNCAACHTIGKGKLVGPDLAGVTSRREESWLVRQIQDPEALIAEEDPIALQLLAEADNVPMPTLELTDDDVGALITYLKGFELGAEADVGLPSQYLPTIIISIVLIVLLTIIGLRVGRKQVDVN